MKGDVAADTFTQALSSGDPTPGGGAAAAMAGAMGCALAMMATTITLKQKSLLQDPRIFLENSLEHLASLKVQLDTFMRQDAKAYETYLSAKKLPKNDPSSASAIEEALWIAASIPVNTAESALQCLGEIDKIAPYIKTSVKSDILCATHLLKACVQCAIENVRINIKFITKQERKNQLSLHVQQLCKACDIK